MEKKVSSGGFVKQASILASAAIISRIIGFVYKPYLTKIIGDIGMGMYSSGFYIYTFFLTFSSAGLPVAISKMVSTRIAEKRYRNAHQVFLLSLLIGSIVSVIACLIMMLGAKQIFSLIKSDESYLTLVTLGPTVVIVAVMSSFRGYFQGMGNSMPTALSQLVEQIVNAFFSVYLAFVFIKVGLPQAVAGGTAATGIGALAGLLIMMFVYYAARPYFINKVKADKNKKYYEADSKILKEILITAFPIIIGTAIFSMTNLIDMAMVQNILIGIGKTPDYAKTAYGLLGNKYNSLVVLPVSISTAFATAAIPSLASTFIKKDFDVLEKKINTAMRITMFVSIPAAFGIGILSDEILLMLFKDYPEGGMLLKIGAISIIFLSLAQIATGMLQGIGKVNIPVYGALMGAIIKIPINFFLIRISGVEVLGAVLGTTGCYMVASIFNINKLIKITKINLDLKTILLKPFFASIIMSITCYTIYNLMFVIFKSNTIAVLLSIAISGLSYFIVMVLIKGIKKEDIKLLPMGARISCFLETINAF